MREREEKVGKKREEKRKAKERGKTRREGENAGERKREEERRGGEVENSSRLSLRRTSRRERERGEWCPPCGRLATKAISVARRHEERKSFSSSPSSPLRRGGGRTFPPPPPYARTRARARRGVNLSSRRRVKE